ncbi:MAG: hypothetical protein E7498_04260 [Ruminococcus sp.]|nr:hypothetical protein [Ruminococcus sp.]
MENQKGIAIIIAFFAGVLVVIAGKSCSASLEDKTQSSPSSGKQQMSISIGIAGDSHRPVNNNSNTDKNTQVQTTEYYSNPDVQYVTDLLGRVIGTVAPEDVTHTEIEYVTDLLGRVVKTEVHVVTPTTTEPPTHIEYITDLLGRVIGTEYAEG